MDWRECVSEVTVCARSVTVSCRVDKLILQVPTDDTESSYWGPPPKVDVRLRSSFMTRSAILAN